MASFLVPHIDLDVHSSIIDCNWYYGCLFSPKKNDDVYSILSVCHVSDYDVHINGSSNNLTIALNNDARDEQGLREDGNNSSNLCFGSTDFESVEICKEDVDPEAECLASMFRVLDEDCDGRISVDEIVRFLERLSLGMPKDEVALAVRSVSACGDNFLTAMEFDEFYRILFADKENDYDSMKGEERTIRDAFRVFDQNGDGFISVTELADVLCRLGLVEGKDANCCQSMIESVDYNGDGFVDIHEFKNLVTRTAIY